MIGNILTPVAYDPLKVKLYLGGTLVTGYAADTMLEIERTDDNIHTTVGVQGDISTALSRNHFGTITIHLQNSSPTHAALLIWQQQADISGLVWFPVILQGSQAPSLDGFGFIQKQPNLTYGTTVGTMSWVIGISDAWLRQGDLSTAVGIGSQITQITGMTL